MDLIDEWELWRTDQGDTFSCDWLEGKGSKNSVGSPSNSLWLFSQQLVHSIMSATHCLCSVFECQCPFDQEKITCFDNNQYTSSTINISDPYPTLYLVRRATESECPLANHTPIDFTKMLAWIYPSGCQGHSTPYASDVVNIYPLVLSSCVAPLLPRLYKHL